MAPFKPVVLEGRFIRLEPLTLAHAPALWAVSSDPEIFRFYPYRVASETDLRQFITGMAAARDQGVGMSFATIVRDGDVVVGSSGFHETNWPHRRTEIGATWVTPTHQRTPVNTEAKYLMLRYAFEDLGMLRVEFKTDSRNTKSRAALTRLGAVEEGTFRNHMVMPNGDSRHSVYFSIIATEWPAVKTRLESRLAT